METPRATAPAAQNTSPTPPCSSAPPRATTPPPPPKPALPAFHKQRQITYWLRCLKTLLPHAYTSLDANRMMAAYFSLAALELLGALDSHATREERRGFAEWIYAAQHPGGGFRAAPAPTPEAEEEEKEGAEPGGSGGGGGGGPDAGDPATVPNTYFALAALAVLRDDLSRVRRGECLRWLGRCQRADGSVGQYVEEDGRPGGGSDTRFSYMAVGVRWFLRGAAGDGGAREGGAEREGLDVEALVRNVAMLQTYDGGFCEVPFREAHGGYVYCAVCTLSILDRVEDGVRDMDALIGWLARRQLPVRPKGEEDADDEDEDEEEIGVECPRAGIGFNGRCNKVVDSCYSWWICATLKALDKLDLIDSDEVLRFLLEQSQHFIGGFSKYPGDPPDIYHSYFGLATLAMLGHADLKPLHTVTCVPVDAITFLEDRIKKSTGP